MSGSKQTTKEAIQLEKPEQPQSLNGYHPSGNSSPPKPDPAQQSTLAQLIRKERDLQKLAHLLAARDAELARIKSSRSWKLLGRYWQFKHDYVLPVLRFFGLASPAGSEQSQASDQGLLFSPSVETTLALEKNIHPGVVSRANACDVICFPIIEWGFRFQRPQQLMSQFAAAGHRVFYLSHKFCPLGASHEIEERAKNIYEVSLYGNDLNVYRDALDAEGLDKLFFSLDALRRDRAFGATVAIVHLPFWLPLAERARAEFGWPIVYDCMDHHAGFSTNAEEMLAQEQQLFASADLVTVSSAALADEAMKKQARPLLLRNACDFDHFAAAGRTKNLRPVIGYYGAIADWFDSDLVADLAKRRPDWDFVLVGSTDLADVSRLIRLPNVTLTGEQPYAGLPRWLTRFDATIIPFKRMPLTEATNPVKAYEILAAGKPLVSVPLPEVAALGSLVRLAETAEEFERQLEAALKEDSPEAIKNRREFAKANTWEQRFNTLAPAVAETFPRASIIIVTFNNLELNRLCLEKLYEQTEWPNYEVIVVDNDSTDGTREFLQEAESAYQNLRVVLNDANLGFAAANNIGLKMATGEFLVLLNNDTVVTRGWLSALLRHLIANPDIGLVGPVTNAIANEARIEVAYQQIEDMPNWAAGYVRDHDCETFSIPMLAMFCVAMRRDVFERTGLLDEQFGVGMFEDDDYCRRVTELGFKLVCARDSFIHHWQRASFKLLGEDEYLRIYRENQSKFEEKWRHANTEAQAEKHREQLREIIARIHQSRGVVIFLASIGWRVNLFQRPHHLAQTFARQGYVAIFDSRGSQDGVNGFEEIEHNLFLFDGAERLLHEIPEPLLWTLPYNFDRADNFPDVSRRVYDWIDDLAVFPYEREFLERNHQRALREAALIASVAAPLHRQALQHRPDAIYLPNGVEYEFFAEPELNRPRPQSGARQLSSALPQDDADFMALLDEGKPIAGYYGALASWFDYDLLDEVAARRTDWNFLLIGQSLDDSLKQHSLLTRANVKWVGPRAYASLPDYLQSFDVALIPFAINDITLATSPLKLYEYLAGGKPVIATPMPECEMFKEVFIARNATEFARLLDIAAERGRDETFRRRLRELAQENSWTARVRAVEHLLEKEPASPIAGQNDDAATSDGVAATIAERFSQFRTATNEEFFAALTRHFAGIPDDSCLPMYFEFAITSNERGRRVANLLRQHTDLRGKRFLDVGCAYGGFLVAFAEQGAEVVGLDVDNSLLELARHNLRDHQLVAPLRLLDATNAEQLSPLHGRFDIVTCNDVIEHVEDPEALVSNISSLLDEGGLAYFEIPNALAPLHVLSDGHYQLFGITLLDYSTAKEYFAALQPGVEYGVRHYLTLEAYRQLFAEHGLNFTLMEESFEGVSLETVLREAVELRQAAAGKLKDLPTDWRERINEALTAYLETLESTPQETEEQSKTFLARYAPSFWRIIVQKKSPAPAVEAVAQHDERFHGYLYHQGRCNVCGQQTSFFYTAPALYREELSCGNCLTSSRYRSIARGILRAVKELTGIAANSLAELIEVETDQRLKIYDTQPAFYVRTHAYPIPDVLARCPWIEVHSSLYRPQQPFGETLGENLTNQNLEALTFADGSFDIVVTSDVMEHIRLDFPAHREIRRVLRRGGVYLFTVPHFRDRFETYYRVAVTDPNNPAKDVFLTEKEFHGDVNSPDGTALSYRSYGTDLDEMLKEIGLSVEYSKEDFPETGILNTELFYCRRLR